MRGVLKTKFFLQEILEKECIPKGSRDGKKRFIMFIALQSGLREGVKNILRGGGPSILGGVLTIFPIFRGGGRE